MFISTPRAARFLLMQASSLDSTVTQGILPRNPQGFMRALLITYFARLAAGMLLTGGAATQQPATTGPAIPARIIRLTRLSLG